MPFNKFVSANKEVVFLDLSKDTVTQEDVAEGKTFHLADGSISVGSLKKLEPVGTKEILENGIYDVKNFANVNVLVASGEGGEGGEFIDVDELPTDNINEEACYRITQKNSSALSMCVAMGDMIIDLPDYLSFMALEVGRDASLTMHLVESLPTDMLPSNVESESEPLILHVYVVESSGTSWVNVNGDVVPAASMFGCDDAGWVEDPSNLQKNSAGVYYRTGVALYIGTTAPTGEAVKIPLQLLLALYLGSTANISVSCTVHAVSELPSSPENIVVSEKELVLPIYVDETGYSYIFTDNNWEPLENLFSDSSGLNIPLPLTSKGWATTETCGDRGDGLYAINYDVQPATILFTRKDGKWVRYREFETTNKLTVPPENSQGIYEIQKTTPAAEIYLYWPENTSKPLMTLQDVIALDGGKCDKLNIEVVEQIPPYQEAKKAVFGTTTKHLIEMTLYVDLLTGIAYLPGVETEKMVSLSSSINHYYFDPSDYGWINDTAECTQTGFYCLRLTDFVTTERICIANGSTLETYVHEQEVMEKQRELQELNTYYNLAKQYTSTAVNNFIDYAYVKNGQLLAVRDNTITEIALPDEVEVIETETFKEFVNLERVLIGPNSKLKRIGNYAFKNCSALKTFDFPDSLEEVGKFAFENCSALRTVNVNQTSKLEKLGSYVFFNSGIEYFYMPASVTDLSSSGIFSCTPNLQTVTFAENTTISRFGTMDDPVAHTSGSSYLFDRSGIRSIVIPKSVEEIGSRCFYGCKNLTDVTFEKGSRFVAGDDSIFAGCSALEEIILPDSLTRCTSRMFEGCAKLRNVTFGKNFTDTGFYSFASSTGFETMELPDTITTIGENSFAHTRITHMNIPSNVSTIKNYAFAFITTLEYLDFTNHTSVPSLGYNALYGSGTIYEIRVPVALYSEWIAKSSWSDISTHIVPYNPDGTVAEI